MHGATSGGDRILANKIVYDFRDPQQGDVVVFAGPETWAPEARIAGPSNWFGSLMQSVGSVVGIAPPNEKDYVKRVIAVGGQTVMCCDADGAVTVDGRSLVEPYIYEPIEFIAGQLDCTTTQMSRRCFGPVTVPEGQLWVMGDHRSDSADSSYQCQGMPASSGAICQGPDPGGQRHRQGDRHRDATLPVGHHRQPRHRPGQPEPLMSRAEGPTHPRIGDGRTCGWRRNCCAPGPACSGWPRWTRSAAARWPVR